MNNVYDDIRLVYTAIATPEDLRYNPLDKHETAYRKLAEIACQRVHDNGMFGDFSAKGDKVGVGFLTRTGEQYPDIYRKTLDAHQRLHADNFLSAIHNSAAGHIAIKFGIRGPQIVLVEGDLWMAARLQIQLGRVHAMLCCQLEMPGIAVAYYLEKAS